MSDPESEVSVHFGYGMEISCPIKQDTKDANKMVFNQVLVFKLSRDLAACLILVG